MGVNQYCWLFVYPWQFVVCLHVKCGNVGLRLGERNGVLGLKAEMDLIFTLLPLDIRDPNMVHIFQLYQPFINSLLHHSNTPVLQER